MPRHQITTLAEAEALFAPLAARSREAAAVAYIGRDGSLLALRHLPSCETGRLTLPVRTVVADALALSAAGVLLAHNHPSGDTAPSAADRALTRRLARALGAVDIELLDHLVMTDGGCTSAMTRAPTVVDVALRAERIDAAARPDGAAPAEPSTLAIDAMVPRPIGRA